MAAFNRKNASGEVNITTLLRAGAVGNIGFTYNDTPYNVFSTPMSNSQANLPYGYGSPVGFTYMNSDLCNSFGPKETGYSASGTHTLNAACTKFMIMAVGGGGGGGGGGSGGGAISSNSGNSGTGGSCIYAAYPIVAGQTTITFTIGTGGSGGAGKPRAAGTGGFGTAGTSTVCTYNGTTYVNSTGGARGNGGSTGSNVPNAASAAPTYNATQLLTNSLISAIGTFNQTPSATTVSMPQADNAFAVQFLLTNHYTNTSSAGCGSGGSSGYGTNKDSSSGYGSAGTSGWVSIFEYFN